MPTERIAFQTNVPVELALRFTEGKAVESKFGTGTQHLFSTTDGRAFYLAEAAGVAVAAQLRELGTQPGEFVTITKAEVDAGRGRKQIRWQVAAVGDAAEPPPPPAPVRMPPQVATPAPVMGDRPDGTYAVPALRPAPALVPAPQAVPDTPEWTRVLLMQTNHLVDVFAATLRHASRHEGLIKPDAVQSLLISAFIGLQKQGGSR